MACSNCNTIVEIWWHLSFILALSLPAHFTDSPPIAVPIKWWCNQMRNERGESHTVPPNHDQQRSRGPGPPSHFKLRSRAGAGGLLGTSYRKAPQCVLENRRWKTQTEGEEGPVPISTLAQTNTRAVSLCILPQWTEAPWCRQVYPL